MLKKSNGKFPARSADVKRFIRKGIPSHLRGKCWLFYSGAEAAMKNHPERYGKLLAVSGDIKYAASRELIERDLHRTFPENIKFKVAMVDGVAVADQSPLLQSLRRVLTAFAVRNPSIGYCQSLNFIAGMFLLFVQEEEAFWMLCTVVERIMPEGMYSVTMDGATADQEVLMQLIMERMPAVWEALSCGDEVPPLSLITSHWFLTLYTDVFPIETTLRVWDCLFYEGCAVLFRIALALIKMHEAQLLSIAEPLMLFQAMQVMPKKMLDCHQLMEACFKKYSHITKLTDTDISRRRKDAREMHRQMKQQIQYS
jgi:hypothetical protein